MTSIGPHGRCLSTPCTQSHAANRPDGIFGIDTLAIRVRRRHSRAVPGNLASPNICRAYGLALDQHPKRQTVLSQDHLRRILRSYFGYYHDWRTHLSLDMDCPEPRAVQPPEAGEIIEIPEVGGLHHHYERRAA